MNVMETLARQLTWACANISANMAFIPADKLEWKPGAEAKSALEIVNHCAEVLHRMSRVLGARALAEAQFSAAYDLPAAQVLLRESAELCRDASESVRSRAVPESSPDERTSHPSPRGGGAGGGVLSTPFSERTWARAPG